MYKAKRFILGFFSVLLVIAIGSACGGSAANNDQGVSFTLLGFFNAVPDDPCGEEPGAVGSAEISISEADETNSAVRSVLGLQNNLTGQFIRTQRIFLKYFIPDASVQPPDTNIPASRLIAPFVQAGSDGGFDSSLPDSFGDEETACNRAYLDASVIPAEVRNFLNLNRSSLPEFPYSMIITVNVSGVTNSGEVHTTNEADLFVQVNSDLTINSSDSNSGTDTTNETDTTNTEG